MPPAWRAPLKERIVRLLKSRGYRVRPDVTMEGRSGRRYEIHAYAEYRAPLHTSRIAVMCLDRREPIGPDEVQELLQILEDLELDRGVIATTSWFTPEAMEAAGRRILLWDGPRVEELTRDLPRVGAFPHELRIYHLPPRLELTRAVERIQGLLRRPLVGRKERLASRVALIYLPVYEFTARSLEGGVEGFAGVDALTGDLLISGEGEVRRIILPEDLTDTELTVLAGLRGGPTLVEDLADSLGLDLDTVDATVRALAGRGLVDDSEVERVSMRIHLPGVEGSTSLLGAGVRRGRPRDRLLEPKMPVGEAAKRLELLLGVEATGPRMVFLPYYYAVAERDGARRVVAVDGIWGREARRVEEVIRRLLSS